MPLRSKTYTSVPPSVARIVSRWTSVIVVMFILKMDLMISGSTRPCFARSANCVISVDFAGSAEWLAPYSAGGSVNAAAAALPLFLSAVYAWKDRYSTGVFTDANVSRMRDCEFDRYGSERRLYVRNTRAMLPDRRRAPCILGKGLVAEYSLEPRGIVDNYEIQIRRNESTSRKKYDEKEGCSLSQWDEMIFSSGDKRFEIFSLRSCAS